MWGAGRGKVWGLLGRQCYDMLWPILLRVAVAFSIPEAPLAQVEAVDAICTLVMHVLPLRRRRKVRGERHGMRINVAHSLTDIVHDSYKVKGQGKNPVEYSRVIDKFQVELMKVRTRSTYLNSTSAYVTQVPKTVG